MDASVLRLSLCLYSTFKLPACMYKYTYTRLNAAIFHRALQEPSSVHVPVTGLSNHPFKNFSLQ
jgi:hypothetical protein